MEKVKSVLYAFGLILGTTIGAGIFALPYVFYKSGWLVSLLHLLGLTLVIIFGHHLFLKTISATGARGNLVGLLSNYFGRTLSFLGSISVVGGLFLTLVAYLVLGVSFLNLIFPGMPAIYALMLFWILSSAPLVWEKELFLKAEFWGSVAMGVLILFISFGATNTLPINPYPDFSVEHYFFPFGAILFSLAGWTAIEPLSKILKGLKRKFIVLAVATIVVSVLYALFVWGIFYSAEDILPDTVSGLGNWTYVRLFVLALLGLFALWTSYIPGAVEIKNSLQALRFNKTQAAATVFFLPAILVLLGFSNFIRVVSLAGGVFLSLQYLFIFLLAQKVLKLKGFMKWTTFFLMAVFVLAAIYETYYFLVR